MLLTANPYNFWLLINLRREFPVVSIYEHDFGRGRPSKGVGYSLVLCVDICEVASDESRQRDLLPKII